jgi:hypothetical protein
MQFLWQTVLLLGIFVGGSYGGMRLVDHFLAPAPTTPKTLRTRPGE